jgi:hypothetical protein
MKKNVRRQGEFMPVKDTCTKGYAKTSFPDVIDDTLQ